MTNPDILTGAVSYRAAIAPTPAVGDVGVVMAGPGYPTDLKAIVTDVAGRTLVAVDQNGASTTYTLRRNGKWAEKGYGQWQMYVRWSNAD